jgi:hypothetical protein
MVDVKGASPDSRTDSADLPATGKLQSIDGALEDRPTSISARAG